MHVLRAFTYFSASDPPNDGAKKKKTFLEPSPFPYTNDEVE